MVRIVGTPIYDVPGWIGPHYSSMIVVRADEPGERLADVGGRRFAYNGPDSLSGYLAFLAITKEAGHGAGSVAWVETGSHRASVRTVAEEKADVAAIDALCWSLALRYEPEAVSRLKVIGQTPLRPAPPFVTAIERDDGEVAAIRAVVKDTIADPVTAPARQALRLTGIGVVDEWAYGPIAGLAQKVA